jgi:predicted N-acetyltransferase YhbS
MDISIRRLVESDIGRADEILNLAFNTTDSRVPELRRYLKLEPTVWLVATANEVPVGTVAAIDYGPFAYVGMMAVHPTAQHQGIGVRLLESLLDTLDNHRIPMLRLDASPTGALLYPRYGFVDGDKSYIFQCAGHGPAGSLPANIHPLTVQELQALTDFDTPFFGANRGRVLKALIGQAPERALATRDGTGHISGYLIAQSQRLGPWVARSPDDAQALLQAALSLPFTAAPKITVPSSNTRAIDLLAEFGFQLLDDTHRHMRRGGTHFPGDRSKIYGQASFALG